MRLLVVAFSLVLATSTFSPASAQSKLDFTLLNQTGLTIEFVYVTPSSSDNWGDDVMGKDVLKHGESVDIEFSRSEKSCTWDLRVEVEDGKEIEWENFDLCKVSHITLQYKGGKPTAITK